MNNQSLYSSNEQHLIERLRLASYLAVWAVPRVGGEPVEGLGGDLVALAPAAHEPQLPHAAHDGRVRLFAALPAEEMAAATVHRVGDLTCNIVLHKIPSQPSITIHAVFLRSPIHCHAYVKGLPACERRRVGSTEPAG